MSEVQAFKPRFTEALEAALAAYPEAGVDLWQNDQPEPGPATDCPDRLTAASLNPTRWLHPTPPTLATIAMRGRRELHRWGKGG